MTTLSREDAVATAKFCHLDAWFHPELQAVVFAQPKGNTRPVWAPDEKPEQFALLMLCAARQGVLFVPTQRTAPGAKGENIYCVGAVRQMVHSDAISYDPDDASSYVAACCIALAGLLLRIAIAGGLKDIAQVKNLVIVPGK